MSDPRQRTVRKKTKWVDVDLQKVDSYLQSKGWSDSQLSKALGRSRGWFYSVRKKLNIDNSNDSIIHIKLKDVLAMAEAFQCEPQDIAVEYVTRKSGTSRYSIENPIVVDYRKKAIKLAIEIAKKDARGLSELLEQYEILDEVDKPLFRAAIVTVLSPENRKQWDDDWWKYILFLDFLDNALPKTRMAAFEDIKGEFLRAMREKEKKLESIKDEKQKKIESYNYKTEIMNKVLLKEWDKHMDDLMEGNNLKDAIGRAATILVNYIIYGKSKTKVDYIRKGYWKVGLLFNFIAD